MEHEPDGNVLLPELAHVLDGPRGDPLVLIGALGSTVAMWDQQLPALAGRRTIRFDLPGHGRSPLPSSPFTVEDVADSVVGTLDRHDIGEFDLVGLSFGGAVAQVIAAAAPRRVRHLVLACTASTFGSAEFWHARATAVRENGMDGVAAISVQRWFTDEFASSQLMLYADLVAALRSTEPRGYAACCEALADFDGEMLASWITAPTLVVVGDRDEATPVKAAEILCDSIAASSLAVIPGGAHLCNVEMSEEFNGLLALHLNDIPM